MQWLSWQDDLLGLSENSIKMQPTMTRLSYSMAKFQMTIHPEKSCYIVYGRNKFKDQEDQGGPNHVPDITMKRVKKTKYLGDMLPKDTLTTSEEATVNEHVVKAKVLINELKALCKDYRLQIFGGIMVVLDHPGVELVYCAK